jgi:hypothetical protein
MSQPFVYVGTYTLKPGKLEAFENLCAGLVQFVELNEPRMLAFNFYCNEDGTEASCVQVHTDADSMVFHMQLLREHISTATEEEGAIDTVTSNQIYGTPSETVLEMIEQFDPGVPLLVKPHPLGGFTRPAPQPAANAS